MSTLISRLYTWVTDKANTLYITASKMDAENDQIIVALNRKSLCSASAPGSPIAGQTWIDTTNKYLKVYLNNEWVIHGPVHIGTAAPATPFEGMCWWDTTNNRLQVYNGSAWLNIPAIASCAAGDIMYHNGTSWVRLAKGTAGQKLKINAGATAPEWVGTELGAWDASTYANNTAYLAATDGFVVGYGTTTDGNSGSVYGYTDASNPPTTVRWGNQSTVLCAICMPVKKGNYWKVVFSGTTMSAILAWIPLGAA